MKKRYIYALMFGIPGFFIALMISFLIVGATSGILWLYLFGDNPWPAWTNTLLPGLFAVVLLAVWIAILSIGYAMGKRLEGDPSLKRGHMLIAGGLTIIFILMIVFQQFSVGNLDQNQTAWFAATIAAPTAIPPAD